MKQSRKTIALLTAVLVLVILLLFANRNLTRQNPQAAGGTTNPVMSPSPDYGATATHILSIPTNEITLTYVASLPRFPTIAITPTIPIPPTATSTLQPPQCTFPLAQTTTEKTMPEEYTFSNPQVVLVAPNSGLNLMEWLPDNQRVLILREVVENQLAQDDSIEVFNPLTTNLQVYAKRKPTNYMLPSWVAGSDVVIYPESLVESLSSDANGRYISSTVVSKRLLRFSNGDPNKIQNIEDTQYKPFILPHEWVLSSPTVKPDGSQIVYLKTNGEQLYQFYSRKISQGIFGTEQLIPFDSAILNYKNYPIIKYEMTWRPNTTQIFLYSSNWQVPSQGYQYLFDVSTGKICELGFSGIPWRKTWVAIAHWSPNGRYLAVSRGLGGTPGGDLAVLDTKTGELHTMEFYPQEIQGSQGIVGIAWAPDNHHLVAISEVSSYPHCEPNCKDYSRLYLVDFISKKADLLFPSFQFLTGSRADSLIWSSDGSKLLATCWNEKGARACLVPVHVSGQ